MRELLSVIRFFRIVSPTPPLMMPAFAVVGVVASLLIVLDSRRAAVAVIPLLLLQLFAASSGFMVPARRGHYDVLLTGGHRRALVAVVHWIMSILPGIATFAAMAIVEVVATAGSSAILLTSGTVAALVVVSTIPWSATVTLPRFTAAIGWLVILALLSIVMTSEGEDLLRAIRDGSSWTGTSLALTLYPPALVGQHVNVTSASGVAAVTGVMLAVGSIVGALVWISRHDIPLEAAQ